MATIPVPFDPADNEPAELGSRAVASEAADASRPMRRRAEAFAHRGILLRRQGRLAEAVACYQEALQHDADYAEAHYNLGLARHQLGQLAEAAACFRHTLRLRPATPPAWFCLGNVLRDQGQFKEAGRCYRQAVELQPNYADAWYNLGNVEQESGAFGIAVQAYQRAVSANPRHVEAHVQLGSALVATGRPQDAVRHYEHAISLRPELAEAHSNLGNACKEIHQLDRAIACYQRALQLKPDLYETHMNLANARKDQGHMSLAAESLKQVIRLRPQQPLHQLRLNNLCPLVFTSREEMHRYRHDFLDACARLSETKFPSDLDELIRGASEPSFNLQFFDGDVRPLKEAYAAVFHDCFPAEPLPPRRAVPRAALVVTRHHEGIFLRSMAGILQRMRGGFEVHIVCAASGAERIRASLPHLPIHILPPRFPRALEMFREAAFDVIYYWEVGTDATNYFLPFNRLAPVQCTSWGHQVTTGIPNVDYYLNSRPLEPADAARHYTEQLVLADTLMTYQSTPPAADATRGREHFGIPARDNVYLCAQNLGKFHPDFDPLLAGVLRRDPRGLFVVTEDQHGFGARRLRARWQQTMPDVLPRVQFLPRLTDHDYRCLIALSDVLLDPPYFSGTNSSYDGFACHKPIVTWPGSFQRSRYTAACYRKMQFDDCAVETAEEYVLTAVQLGTDPDRRRHVQQILRERVRELFEDERAVSEHQRIFEELIARARD